MVFLVLCSPYLWGQYCDEQIHSTNNDHMWSTCIKSDNPNPIYASSHWILYDLGHIYSLGSTKFWNYNEHGSTMRGAKSVQLSFSTDASHWSDTEAFQLDEAPGHSGYDGQLGPNLGGVEVQYILLTFLDSWGDSCVGLSEVRFDIKDDISLSTDVFADESQILLFPNPTAGQFIIQGNLKGYDIEILDALGKVTEYLSTIEDRIVIDLSHLPDGLYFVRIRHTSSPKMFMELVLKQS